MSKQIELTLSKETKGTFVYASIDENSLITASVHQTTEASPLDNTEQPVPGEWRKYWL